MAKFADYQLFSTIASRIGGPKVLIAAAIFTGGVAHKGGELLVKKVASVIKHARADIEEAANSALFTFQLTADDGHGFQAQEGGEFRVIGNLGETLEVEVIGDDKHHYVETTFIERVSEWRRPTP